MRAPHPGNLNTVDVASLPPPACLLSSDQTGTWLLWDMVSGQPVYKDQCQAGGSRDRGEWPRRGPQNPAAHPRDGALGGRCAAPALARPSGRTPFPCPPPDVLLTLPSPSACLSLISRGCRGAGLLRQHGRPDQDSAQAPPCQGGSCSTKGTGADLNPSTHPPVLRLPLAGFHDFP